MVIVILVTALNVTLLHLMLLLAIKDKDRKYEIGLKTKVILSSIVIISSVLTCLNGKGLELSIDACVLSTVMIFCAYTDIKTETIYTLPIVIIWIYSVIKCIACGNLFYVDNLAVVAITAIVVATLTLTNNLGMGDSILVMAILNIFIYSRDMPVVSFVLCMVASAILSIPYMIAMMTKYKEKDMFGYTVFIAVPIVISNIFNV